MRAPISENNASDFPTDFGFQSQEFDLTTMKENCPIQLVTGQNLAPLHQTIIYQILIRSHNLNILQTKIKITAVADLSFKLNLTRTDFYFIHTFLQAFVLV